MHKQSQNTKFNGVSESNKTVEFIADISEFFKLILYKDRPTQIFIAYVHLKAECCSSPHVNVLKWFINVAGIRHGSLHDWLFIVLYTVHGVNWA